MPLVHGVGDEVLYALIAVFGIPLWLLRSSPHLRVSLLSLFRSTPPHATRSISSNQNLGGTAIPSGTAAAAATATASVTGSGGVGPASGFGPAVGVGPARGFGPASGVFQAEGIGAAAEAAARAAAEAAATTGGGGGGGAAVEAARAGGEAMAAGSEPRPPEGEMCCVCHDAFALPTQANCGHWFCAECILRVWHHSSALVPCKCPICRRTITLLLPSHSVQTSPPTHPATQPMPSPDPPAPALDDQQRATCTLSTPDPARPSLEQRTESQGAVSSEPGETQRRESLRPSPSSSSEASQQQRQQEQPPQQEEKENRPQQQHHHNPPESAAGEGGNPNLGVSATASAAASEPSDSDRLSDGALPLSPEHSVELLGEVARYNRLFGGVPVSLWQRILDMPLLLSRLGRDLTDPLRALRLLHNARMVFCVAIVFVYVLSPFDLIPE
ncbi:unnamed protein product, partial [Closterium sp. Naga37s-1]